MSSPAGVRILKDSEVKQILSRISLQNLLDNQDQVFRLYSSSNPDAQGQDSSAVTEWEAPQRLSLGTPFHIHLIMPARLGSISALKWVAVPRPNADPPAPPGLPAVGLVFDEKTGKLRAMINQSILTAARTAAGSLLASITALNGKDGRDSAVAEQEMVVFGSGGQAYWHAMLFARFWYLSKVTFITRSRREKDDEDLRVSFQSEYASHGRTIGVVLVSTEDVQGEQDMYASLSTASYVACCTPSTRPLFRWDKVKLKEGCHFSLIGSYKPHMQEVPPQLIDEAASYQRGVIVDSIAACSEEAGDLLKSSTTRDQWVELGALRGATSSSGLSISSEKAAPPLSVFKSVGLGLQDVAILDLVMQYADRDSIGQIVEFH